MALSAAQRTDLLNYAKRRRSALVTEHLHEKWMGCESKSIRKKLAYLGVLLYVLDETTPSNFLTEAQIDKIYDRLKCVVQYDYDKADATVAGKTPWLTYDSIDWDGWSGLYWQLP